MGRKNKAVSNNVKNKRKLKRTGQFRIRQIMKQEIKMFGVIINCDCFINIMLFIDSKYVYQQLRLSCRLINFILTKSERAVKELNFMFCPEVSSIIRSNSTVYEHINRVYIKRTNDWTWGFSDLAQKMPNVYDMSIRYDDLSLKMIFCQAKDIKSFCHFKNLRIISLTNMILFESYMNSILNNVEALNSFRLNKCDVQFGCLKKLNAIECIEFVNVIFMRSDRFDLDIESSLKQYGDDWKYYDGSFNLRCIKSLTLTYTNINFNSLELSNLHYLHVEFDLLRYNFDYIVNCVSNNTMLKEVFIWSIINIKQDNFNSICCHHKNLTKITIRNVHMAGVLNTRDISNVIVELSLYNMHLNVDGLHKNRSIRKLHLHLCDLVGDDKEHIDRFLKSDNLKHLYYSHYLYQNVSVSKPVKCPPTSIKTCSVYLSNGEMIFK